MIERTNGSGDPRIDLYRDIADAEFLRSRGLFVAEGRLVVQRVLEDRALTVRSVLVSESAYRALEPVLTVAGRTLSIYICEAADFLSITGHDIHRGCLALVERPPRMTVADLLARSRAPRLGIRRASRSGTTPCATLVVLEAVTNADNVGGVFRNVAAFGADGVLLSPTTCDPLYRKAIRTSMAATVRVPYARVDPWPAGLNEVRSAWFTIVALTPRKPSMPLEAFASEPRPQAIAFLVGTEGLGLSAGSESMADVRVRIHISPVIDSLNLAVAVGIALHALRYRSG